MKNYEHRGDDIWLDDDGNWKIICQVSDAKTAQFLVDVLNAHEREQIIKAQQNARCERYRLRNEQTPPKKKQIW